MGRFLFSPGKNPGAKAQNFSHDPEPSAKGAASYPYPPDLTVSGYGV